MPRVARAHTKSGTGGHALLSNLFLAQGPTYLAAFPLFNKNFTFVKRVFWIKTWLMSTIQIKSNVSVEELIESLSQLDTPTLNQVVASLRKVQLKRKGQVSVAAMPESEFWQLLEKIDWKQDNDSARLQPLMDALATYPVDGIYQFSERMALLLHRLDGPAFTQALEQGELGFSADTFLYARCLVVAKGEAFYKAVLAEPFKMPVDEDLEALLYVAQRAYEQKTGKTYNYVPAVNYESFFNRELWGERAN